MDFKASSHFAVFRICFVPLTHLLLRSNTLVTLLIVFWVCMAPLTILLAQTKDIISRSFSVKEGLANDYVLCTLQDSQGFLWVGTEGGLSKFDGYHFTTYRENPSVPNSLSNNFIHSLWEDKQQRLWIGTLTGLDLLDLKTNKFHHLLPNSLDLSKGADIYISKIQERKDGKVWICTSRGIYLVDPQTLSITRSIHFPQDADGVHFNDIAEARDGSIWAGSGNEGLFHWDAHTGQTTRYRNDPGNPRSLANNLVWTVHIDRHERVWAGTQYGLDLFDPDDRSFTHFLPEQLQSGPLDGPIIQVHTLFEHADGKFWTGLNHGLYDFDPETGKFNLLMNKFIWSLFQDRRGSLWVGSGYGLFQIAPQSKKFKIYRKAGQTDFSFILSLAEGADDQIWISAGSGLFRFDPFSRRFFKYLHDPDNPHSYSCSMITGIIPDHEGGVWMASYGKLEKFNPQNQTFSSIALPISPGNKLPAMLIDSKGRIWIGEWDGVGIYDPQTETHQRLAAFPNVTVHSFLEDREENIWIGTINGLFRYSLKTGQLDVFKNDPADPKSLSNNRIYHLMMDQNGTVWIGTAGGLNRMIPRTEKEEPTFIHWQTTHSDLPRDDVFSVIDGGDGTLWISCGNMISHFFPKTGIFRNYDHNDGLTGQSIGSFGRGLRSRNGEIYFGTIEGLVTFHPDSLQNNPYTPPLAITGFSIHNQPMPVQGSYGDTLSWKTPQGHDIPCTEVELTYRQNDFSLEFAALNFINPENNLYKYKLEPYEEDWIETAASNRIARYTNLSPGRYTFRVIGSNNDGVWNNEGRSLSIIIHPPWWQTWWAYSLYGLLGISMLYGLIYYSFSRVRLRSALKLQRLEAEKMHEIDHMKSRFFANISHEFRTPLTLILGPVKKLIDKYPAPDDQNYLSGIQRNAQRLLNLVNQLLDLAKLEAGKLKLEAVKSDIVAFLKARADAFSSLADHKNIRFAVELPEEKVGAYFDIDKLEKIINNLLSNAFKFTPEGGIVKLEGRVVTQGNKAWIQIQMTDSGKGIPAEEINKIFNRFYQVDSSKTREHEGTGIGLALTKELVELHHGTIQVESTPRQRTVFTLLLPLGKDHLNEEEIIHELPLPEGVVGSDEARLYPSEILSHSPNNHLANEATPKEVEKPVVLIVEDHQEVRRFIRESISPHYQVREAEHGVMGLEMAQELLPDLIISDIMMPQMDGYKLCERIKSNELTSHIPVILLTAKADRDSKLAGLETGADDYLSKPFDADELKLLVRNRIEERRKIRERFSREITLEPKQISITSFDEKFLTKVLAIIEDHMDDENFSIEELSREVGYSNMHLYRKIKALTAQTPSVFVRTIRLKRAAQLLIGKSDNVTQIAYSVGFSSLAYFNKCFKEQFGTAPGQFAKHILPKE